MIDPPTTADGFIDAEEALRRYAAQSDRDLGEIPYYVAFQLWRLAAIIEGVRFRFAQGAMGDKDIGDELEATERRIDRLAELSAAQLDRLS